jgi:DNA-binding response OmpR family regulator
MAVSAPTVGSGTRKQETMMVFLVSGSRLLQIVLDQWLGKHGLDVTPADLDAVLDARDQPLVVLQVPQWDAAAETQLRCLVDRRAMVFLVCRGATHSGLIRTILELGAAEVAADDRDALGVLAVKIARCVQQRQVVACPLGKWVFQALEGNLVGNGRVVALSATEWRLLRRLCSDAIVGAPSRLTPQQLAHDLLDQGGPLESREASVRNYIAKLRRKLEDDPDHPHVLQHDAKGYYVVLNGLHAPSGNPGIGAAEPSTTEARRS